MQALLSYEQSPPLAAPFRFFLTAPCCGVLAGLLLIVYGEDALVMRWTPAALALTHAVTAGFMLQAMLGALIQILPVVVGVNLAAPGALARRVHALSILGLAALTLAFLSFEPWAFRLAAALFALALGDFLWAVARAFAGARGVGATFAGLRLAAFGLAITGALGVLLAAGLGELVALPLVELTDTHAVWGFVAWGGALLAAVAYVVVPMFQLTPAYPARFERHYVAAALLAVALWTALDYAGRAWVEPGSPFEVLPTLALAGVAACGAGFAAVSLAVMRRSQRATLDATQILWRAAMASAFAAVAVWGAAQCVPGFAEWPAWPVLFAVLLLGGGFVSVIAGMLYKIVPFLVWLHLQNAGQGRRMAPNMRKIVPEAAMQRQMCLHLASVVLLAAAVFWPEALARPAGVLIVLAQGALLLVLRHALATCREHEAKLAALPPAQEAR